MDKKIKWTANYPLKTIAMITPYGVNRNIKPCHCPVGARGESGYSALYMWTYAHNLDYYTIYAVLCQLLFFIFSSIISS